MEWWHHLELKRELSNISYLYRKQESKCDWIYSVLLDYLLVKGQAQRVTVDGVTSDWTPVTGGVLGGSILGPVLFNTFMDDLDALDTGQPGILSKFTDDTNLEGVVDLLEGKETQQRDLEKLGGWAITNHVKFSQGRCQIPCLGWDSPGCMNRLGNEMLESSPVESDLGILISGMLDMSQQCPGIQEGQPCPGGHQAQHHQLGNGGVCPSLLCSEAASPRVLCAVLRAIILK
ncbi:hypothetical protein DUI87_08073 [Hirundo rustica rustica]|uniref:Reverse transcriptase domain-containing protein n=1 Tax=Hirundo rustica rustica TaxID=333673 RepID=A0A3M0KRI2_HIRRU|nr:hypothetical protein DUI87_08073 [Hirundo rustica rustica]